MAKNQVQAGNTLTLLAPYNVASGAMCKVGSIVGVAQTTALQGAQVEVAVTEVHDLAKVSAQAWAVGDPIYWDDSAKLCTTTAGSNTLVGYATAIAANPSSTGHVRLGAPSTLDIAAVAALADIGGSLTGATDGSMQDIAAINLSTSNTYTDAAVNSAVNTAITAINVDFKELQAKVNDVLARLRTAGLLTP